jgi:hypothetical protein
MNAAPESVTVPVALDAVTAGVWAKVKGTSDRIKTENAKLIRCFMAVSPSGIRDF